MIEKMYGSYYSPTTVSNISKQMFPKIQAYHQRKLTDKFFCVYLDATYISLKRITYAKEAVYVAIGIQPNGHKEVIDYRIEPTESIKIWTEMLNNFKQRNLKQVKLFLSDGVVGMKEALTKVNPKTHFQRCLVHIMRNISAKVPHEFYKEWKPTYKSMIKDVKVIKDELLTFYPRAIRAPIYTNNLVESFNNVIKRKVKPKAEFSTEESRDTLLEH